MENMFSLCKSLNEINLKSFNTENASMKNMFSGCSSLEKLNLSSFYCKSEYHIEDMFKDCANLKELECDSKIIINEYNWENEDSKRNSAIIRKYLHNKNLFGYHNPSLELGIGFNNYL